MPSTFNFSETIFQYVPDPVLVINPAGVVLFANSVSETFFPVLSQSLVGKNLADIIGYDEFLSRIDECNAVEEKIQLGKKQFVVYAEPIQKDNSLAGYLLFFRDNTVRARPEEPCFTASFMNIYEKVLSVVPIPMILLDRDSRIVIINNEYAKFLGVDKDEAVGKHIQSIIPTSRVPLVIKTGVAEIAQRFTYLDGREAIVHRIPIWDKEEVAGCFGMVLFKDIDELKLLAREIELLQNEMNYYKSQLKNIHLAKYSLQNIISCNDEMEKMKKRAIRAGKSRANVLVTGESGVGKELVVHGIHLESQRRDSPFISVNCAAIPENLLESELFGYEEGAFTGAKKGGKVGKIELAHTGTLFLDEIGDMPLAMQAKMLRVLQERVVERIGSKEGKPVDVRIIAATNRGLEKMVDEGLFRADLYYRLNVLTIHIPPLRERTEDIPLLCDHFLSELHAETGIFARFEAKSLALMCQYSWPGNVRELRSILERILTNIDGNRDIITVNDLPLVIVKKAEKDCMAELQSLDDAISKAEKQVIADTLKATNYNKADAANILKIPRSRLYRKIKKYHLL